MKMLRRLNMLNKEDIKYLLDHIENDGSDLANKVQGKLEVLVNQLDLQEEFRKRSMELQDKMKELDK